MDELTRALAKSLFDVLYDLHPLYANSTGPYGGIGGQAITQWCHIKDPYIDEHQIKLDNAERVLRDALLQAEVEGIDLINPKEKP